MAMPFMAMLRFAQAGIERVEPLTIRSRWPAMTAGRPSLDDRLARAVGDHHAGRLGDAEAGYRAVLEAAPENFDALHMLGVVAHQRGRQTEAAALIRKALERVPDSAEAHFNLGNVLRAMAEDEEACEAFRRAAALKPDYAEAHNNLGVGLRALGRLEEAASAYRCAIACAPRYAEAHNNRGSLLEVMGDKQGAAACWRRAIEIKPGFAEAYRNLAQGGGLTQAEIAAARRFLESGALARSDALSFCFALGEAYDATGAYDTAFPYLARGNRLKRATLGLDLDAEEAMNRRIAKVFTSRLFDERGDAGAASELPIFIVGMPRSGTSLVEQIVASHSKVFGAGELDHIGRLAGAVGPKAEGGFPERIAALDGAALRALGRAYLDRLRSLAPGAARVTDKMPNNVPFLGFIRLILPNAKLVHVTRDPMDTCFACYRRLFDRGQHFSYDLAELGRHYRNYRESMNHWQAVLPGRIFDLGYEALVADPEAETRRLLGFLALDWENACLDFHRNPRPVKTASAAQVRQPIYRSALGRWRRYERHLGALREALGPLADAGP